MALLDFNLGDVGGIFKDIREAITGETIKDPMKLAELEADLQKLEHAANMGQIAVNKEEAKHSSIFVAGARPAILWVCAAAFAYTFIGHPIIEWYVSINDIVVDIPELETDYLLELTMAMLGFGGLRTYEKLKGVARGSMKE